MSKEQLVMIPSETTLERPFAGQHVSHAAAVAPSAGPTQQPSQGRGGIA